MDFSIDRQERDKMSRRYLLLTCSIYPDSTRQVQLLQMKLYDTTIYYAIAVQTYASLPNKFVFYLAVY